MRSIRNIRPRNISGLPVYFKHDSATLKLKMVFRFIYSSYMVARYQYNEVLATQYPR